MKWLDLLQSVLWQVSHYWLDDFGTYSIARNTETQLRSYQIITINKDFLSEILSIWYYKGRALWKLNSFYKWLQNINEIKKKKLTKFNHFDLFTYFDPSVRIIFWEKWFISFWTNAEIWFTRSYNKSDSKVKLNFFFSGSF
jgi:hypothetical protein